MQTVQQKNGKEVNITPNESSTQAGWGNVFSAYQPNYVLPFYYNNNQTQVFSGPDGQKNKNTEVNFQISVQAGIWRNIFATPLSWYFTYTQRSFWQAYNDSAYFRETDYEPSTFLLYSFSGNNIIGLKTVSLGFVHQSNGKGGENERSWNRVFSNWTFKPADHWLIQVQPWLRVYGVLESKDYNPDITDYMGHGNLKLSYRLYNNVFTVMLRNNLESGFKRGAVQLSWSFPIYHGLRGMAQVFTGYGQSLISYNHYNTGLGLGIDFTDWLLN
ncbi:phospholipase A [Facilibium subflavum]|uniref:phospholipase A n=1 Tax=Facilibium subflavum TaxID=2219058 RepID=UPI0013C36C44|nr:phospholipase A [Facilibium subflavum]